MRHSRRSTLPQSRGTIHLFWQCINKEFFLKRPGSKRLLFQSLILGLNHQNTDASIRIHSFCIMNNHVHEQVSYSKGITKLSHFMRVAHGYFARRFNRKFNRTGPVLNSRPKTHLISDPESEMRVHFYIEANPIRARIKTFETLRDFYWNSFRYYAFGELDEWTKHLSPPEWYIQLGSSPQVRQMRYRRLFQNYLKEHNLIEAPPEKQKTTPQSTEESSPRPQSFEQGSSRTYTAPLLVHSEADNPRGTRNSSAHLAIELSKLHAYKNIGRSPDTTGSSAYNSLTSADLEPPEWSQLSKARVKRVASHPLIQSTKRMWAHLFSPQNPKPQ